MRSLGTPFVLLALSATLLFPLGGCDGNAEAVVVYCSVDQDFAEVVIQAFREETGLEVAPVFDVEATKTTGLFQRLLAEKDHPQADVFWNGEFVHTLALKEVGLLAPYRPASDDEIPALYRDPEGTWHAVSARARVIAYNAEMVEADTAPRGLDDLLDPRWRGKVAVADPLFGTTATHFAALWALRGEKGAQAWWNGLLANEVKILPGNGPVKNAVARGECAVGLTDTDDLFVGLADGKPLGFVYPDQEGEGTLIIPGTASILQGAPHPELARRFMDFLLSRKTEEILADLRARQMPLRSGVEVKPPAVPLAEIKGYELGLPRIAEVLDESARWIRSRRGLE